METLVAWILTILVFGIIIGLIFFVIQFKQIKVLKSKIISIEDMVEFPEEKDFGNTSLKLIEQKIINGTNKELSMFVHELYWANDSKLISKDYPNLTRLDEKVIEYGLIRLSALEDSHDLSKFLAPTVVILLAVLTAYNTFFQEILFKDSLLFQFGFPLLIIIGTYIYLSILIGETRRKRAAIIFFKGLLQYAKEVIK